MQVDQKFYNESDLLFFLLGFSIYEVYLSSCVNNENCVIQCGLISDLGGDIICIFKYNKKLSL